MSKGVPTDVNNVICSSILEELSHIVTQKDSAEKDEKLKNVLSGLHQLYGDVIFGSLDIADRLGVVKLCSETGRTLFQVTDTSGAILYCFDIAQPYCSCAEFEMCLNSGGITTCKHLLAIRVCEALGRVETKFIDAAEYQMRLRTYLTNTEDID